MVNKNSYTSASAIPIKVLKHRKLLSSVIEDKKIIPIHLQISITNKCQLNCSFCSCSKRDKKLELSFKEIKKIMRKARLLGCESLTVTGGGEPTLHPNFDKIICYIDTLGIEIGLVTNGIALATQHVHTLRQLTWCRISFSDYRAWDENFINGIQCAITASPTTDWAFSYVQTSKPDYDKLAKVISFANKHNFNHVRVVSDLLDLDNIADMKQVKIELDKRKIDDSRVIYQGRKDSTPGTKDCLISLLKPVIATNGYLYGCCGSQYAEKDPAMDFGNKRMRMGKAIDIDKIINKQKNFDGSICKVCYYSNYNHFLKVLKEDLDHERFV